jgi:hypothetical protein
VPSPIVKGKDERSEKRKMVSRENLNANKLMNHIHHIVPPESKPESLIFELTPIGTFYQLQGDSSVFIESHGTVTIEMINQTVAKANARLSAVYLKHSDDKKIPIVDPFTRWLLKFVVFLYAAFLMLTMVNVYFHYTPEVSYFSYATAILALMLHALIMYKNGILRVADGSGSLYKKILIDIGESLYNMLAIENKVYV